MFRLIAIFTSLPLVIGTGTVFFRYVEGWSWLDAYFFTVVTLSTVGYGELVPATPLGKIGTTIFIFTGLGVFALAIQQFTSFAVQKHEKRLSRRAARHHHHDHPAPSPDSEKNT